MGGQGATILWVVLLVSSVAVHLCLASWPMSRMPEVTLSWEMLADGRRHWSSEYICKFRRGAGALLLCMAYAQLAVVPQDQFTRHDTLATFSMWCLLLCTTYFLSAGYLSACHSSSSRGWKEPANNFGYALWITFEVAFASSVVAFLSVWMALAMIADAGIDGAMVHPFIVIAHCLPVVLMICEARVNDLHFEPTHMFFAGYFGLAYIAHSELYMDFAGGKFLYFFIDWHGAWTPLGVATVFTTLCLSFIVGMQLKSGELDNLLPEHVSPAASNTCAKALPLGDERQPLVPKDDTNSSPTTDTPVAERKRWWWRRA